MPHAIASSNGVAPVEIYDRALRYLLGIARRIKPEGGIEPALSSGDFGESIDSFRDAAVSDAAATVDIKSAAIEIAIRRVFYEILVSVHSNPYNSFTDHTKGYYIHRRY